jgi:diamine N-acetyltransferase
MEAKARKIRRCIKKNINKDIQDMGKKRLKMVIHMIPNQWETAHLVVKDSIMADLPELDHVFAGCAYMQEWSGWGIAYFPPEGSKTDDHPESAAYTLLTEGELPPNGSKEFFRLQSIRLRDTGQMIGFVSMYHGYPTANIVGITYLFIHPDFQGKGHGQELVCGLCDQLMELEFTAIRLLVDVKNWPALRFWVQAGFDKIIQYHGDKILSDKTFAHLTLEKTLVS